MPRIVADFDNVDKPIDSGTYLVEITGNSLKTAKTDNSTYIAWEMTICEEGAFLGRKLYYNSNLADKKDEDSQRKANYFLREFLKAFGVPWDPEGFDTESAMHCQAIAKVDKRMYEGREVNNVQSVMPTPARQAALEAEAAAAKAQA